MLICEVCGKVNPEGNRNCDYCGAHLGSAETLPPASAPLLLASSPDTGASGPVCPKCRRGNRMGAVFCTHCGYDLAKSSLPQLSKPTGDGGPSRQPSGPLDYNTTSVAANVTGNLPPGMVLKRRYRILRKIAQGGMGAVYESNDIQAPAGTRWAVKEISPAALAPDERRQAIADFRREAQILATLHHPNLPAVVETFEEMGKHFLVMEFVPGRTLLNMVEGTSGYLPEDRVTVWARQLFDVLHYLHSQNPPIIYRDLKPANVMLVEGTERIKLIDFGIARFHKAGKSHDTEAFGTAGYAPPEQYGKGQTDMRSDIYALGAMLHHLVTRHDPSLNPFNWLPIRRYNRNLSVQLESAIARAVCLDSAKRFQSMAEFAQAMGITLPGSDHKAATRPVQLPKPSTTTTTPTLPQPASRPTGDSLVNGSGTSKPVPAVPPVAPPVTPQPPAAPIAPAASTPVSPPVPIPAPAPFRPKPAAKPAIPPTRTNPQKPGARPRSTDLPAAIPLVASAAQAILDSLARPATAPRPSTRPPFKPPTPAETIKPAPIAPAIDESLTRTQVITEPPQAPDTTQDGTPTQSAELKTLPSSEAKGQPSEDPVLDLGEVKWNSKPVRKLALRSAAGSQMKGTIIATQPWIAYNPQHFNGNPVTLEVKVKHRELPFARTELQVPNLFAIIWAQTRRVLPFIGFWFWVMILAGSAIGRVLPWALVGVIGGLALAELLIWVWTVHVRYLVPSKKLNTGRLMVKSTEGDRQIEVRVVARPSWVRRAAGWTGALLLLLAEVAAVAWIVLAITGNTTIIPGL